MFETRVLQLECQLVKKDNDMHQQKYLHSSMVSDMQQDEQRLSELRFHVENLKNVNSSLQRDIKSLQDVISEQRVREISLLPFLDITRQACSLTANALSS